MNKDVLVIIRHKLGRKRLLKRSFDSVSNQTFINKSVVIFCMDFKKEESSKHDYLSIIDSSVNFIDSNQDLAEYVKDSSAEMVCFLDDDDSWAPEYLSRLLSMLIKTNSSYVSVKGISCHTNKVNEICEGNRIIINDTQPWNHYLNVGPLDFDAIHYANSVPLSSCVFFKNSISDLLLSHEVNSPSFSWPFLIEFLSKNDIWILPEALSFYHFREKNDNELGNYSLVDADEFSIKLKVKLNNLMRRNGNTDFLTLLLNTILNKTNFHRIASVDRRVNGE